jgi:hypothetical protein
VTWRSLIHYARRVLARDLAPLPSEISILGGHFPTEKDMEEDPGKYITEDVAEDVAENVVEDVTEDVVEDRSNRDTIGGLQEHGGHRYRPIDHRLWGILANIPGTFVYHVYPYDPGSFQSHIPPHHPQR